MGQCSIKTRRWIFGLHCHYTNVWFFRIPATVNRRWIVGPFLIRICSKHNVWLVGIRTGKAPLIYWNLSVLCVHYAVYKRRHATQLWRFAYVTQFVYFHKWQCPTTQGNIAKRVLKHAQRVTRVCCSPFLMCVCYHVKTDIALEGEGGGNRLQHRMWTSRPANEVKNGRSALEKSTINLN